MSAASEYVAQAAKAGPVPETAPEFAKAADALEAAGMLEFSKDDEGNLRMRVTEFGDAAFGVLGLALPFDRVSTLWMIALDAAREQASMKMAGVALGEKNDD